MFWCPEHLTVNANGREKTEDFPLPATKEGHKFNFVNSQGLLFEADEVKRCLESDLLETPLITAEESIQIAKIQQEINRQIGVQWLLPK